MTAPAKSPARARSTRSAGLARVLVGTDLSLDGDRALRRVGTLALAPRAMIVVAHVLPATGRLSEFSLTAGAAELELEKAVRKLSGVLLSRGRADVAVHARVVRGKAVEGLDRLAEAMGADVVVVGRRGQSRIRELLIGSTARRLLREGRFPVLVVARPPKDPYRRVVAGFDFTPEALKAVRLADRLVPLSTTRTVVHAFAASGARIPLREREAQVRRAIDQLAAGGAKGWETFVQPGDARVAILEVARTTKADLITVGSGKSRPARTLLGSVAEEVLERATCDVLLVRRH